MGQRTGRVAVLGTALTACALFLGSAAAWAQGIVMSKVTGDKGQTIQITATLATGGAMVAGTQNDFSFDPVNTPVETRGTTTLRPDCTVNPDISKSATSFAFQPAMCQGTACVRVRAIVFATDNVDPIPDGSVLYTCDVAVSATAADGEYPLDLSGTILSNPEGTRVCGTGTSDPPCSGNVNGSITVGMVGPTATPTEQPVGGPGIIMSMTSADAGQTVDITATLDTGSMEVAGTQNDFSFDPVNTPVGTRGTTTLRPDCTVNPDINKSATSFAFQPAMCQGTACVRVRAIVFATDNVDPIPQGSVLYTCKVNVAATAADGSYPLDLSGTILSNPDGQRVCGTGTSDPPCTGNRNGAVNVGVVGPTNTPTPVTPGEATNTPTQTATSGATSTPTPPTGVPTRTATPTVISGQSVLSASITAVETGIPVANANAFPQSGTVRIGEEEINYSGITLVGGGPQGVLNNAQRGANGTTAAAHAAGSLVQLVSGPQPQNDDDGCSCIIASNGGSPRKAWMVLIPVIGLLILRRRYR